MSGHETGGTRGLSDRTKVALALSASVVVPGLANYALGRVGYDTLGSLVWAGGYFGMMIVIWYVWVRPLELTGPAE